MSNLRRTATQKAAKQARNRELGRIHILKAELNLDRDQYEEVLWAVARVESAAKLDDYGRRAVIKHLEAHIQAKSGGRQYPGRPRNANVKHRTELRKIEAYLTDSGRPWAYASALAKRMYEKDRLEFCKESELAGIIAALDREAKQRLGVELGEIFGDAWEDAAGMTACLLFGFSSTRRIGGNAQAMSMVVRWYRGRLQAVCKWPVDPQKPQCCDWCAARAGVQAKP